MTFISTGPDRNSIAPPGPTKKFGPIKAATLGSDATNLEQVEDLINTAVTSTLEGNDNVFTGANEFTQPIQYAGATGLTALAGGAQAGTAITEEYSNFTTVATAADSAQLP